MKKIFIDTNILLDVLLKRPEFHQAAAHIWADCESGKAEGCISAISLNNLHFIMARKAGKNHAIESVRIVLNIFKVIPLDDKILRLAAEFPHKDFEDAIQLFSAVQSKADCIITRDTSHFPKEYLPVISPTDYLQAL
ncbi:MAG: PIN domain-containing protein [Lentisphaerae bacterium]|jgi:predicted nucleic acid-binding protein|nr:PIN domain-containing protein [Lentisphaerota bacterium]